MDFEQVFSRQYTVQAGRVEAHVAEAGAGPPLVLLHGNPDTHTVWSTTVAELAAHHRCIAPDLPGFGRSVAPDDFDWALENQGGYVRDLLDALDLPRAHLAIHDVGGEFGLSFATLEPARVQSLTIFNTNFFPDTKWHFWARVWRTRGFGELAMAIANRPLFVRELRRGSPTMPLDYANHAYREFARTTKRTVLRWYRAMDPEVHRGWDERMRAATDHLPKQVIWGDLDPFLPAATAERFGGTVHRFADCGHWAMQEQPARAAQLIAAHVARASSRASA